MRSPKVANWTLGWSVSPLPTLTRSDSVSGPVGSSTISRVACGAPAVETCVAYARRRPPRATSIGVTSAGSKSSRITCGTPGRPGTDGVLASTR